MILVKRQFVPFASVLVLFFVVGFPQNVEAQSENDNAKAILGFFYPNNPPTEITEGLKELAQKMAADANEKSGWLDKVPRPSGWKPGLGYLAKAGYGVFKAGADKGVYEAVRVTLARYFKTTYELLLLGIDIN